MDLPAKAIHSGSALATKHRIAAGSGSSAASNPKLPQQTHSKLPASLTFKKKPPDAKDTSSPTDRLSHLSSERKSNEKEFSSMSNVQASGSSTAGHPGVAGPSSASKQTVDEPPHFENAAVFEVDNVAAPPPTPA